MAENPTPDTGPSQEPATRYPKVSPDPKGIGPHVPPVNPDGTRYGTASVAAARGARGMHLPYTFGDYELLEVLGRGGMGVVYKARQRIGSGERLVALKVIREGRLASPEAVERFLREARSAAKLDHPGIVPVYDINAVEGRPYFTMQYLPGGSLAERLRQGPLPPRKAARLLRRVAEAVQHAHEHGVIHRDLKPANILLAGAGHSSAAHAGPGSAPEPEALSPGNPSRPAEPIPPAVGDGARVGEWVPKVTDFGLARTRESELSQTGEAMGTPGYMPPEQARGRAREFSPALDVYGLGALLYCLLTGRPPFQAADVLETMRQVCHDEPVSPRQVNPAVPRDLETICLKCLRKEPEKRYQSARALAEDLQRFQAGEPIRARQVRLGERALKWLRRRPTAAALVGILVAVGLALPVVGLQFSAQMARRHAAEQKRLDEARGDVNALRAQGQTASLSKSWQQAEVLLNRALAKSAAEPALADLRGDVEATLAPVQARLAALDIYRRFTGDRDEALFHATLAGGENFQTSRDTAQVRARAALGAVGLSPQGQGALGLGSSFTPEERAEITTGSYALLLLLAETEARRLPRQTLEEHRRCLQKGLALLERAEGLGVRTRAIHLRRARYLTLLGDHARAAKATERARQPVGETDLDPQDHFLVGHELYSQGELGPANLEFHRALQRNPKHFWTHYFLGICCISSAKPEVAVAHLSVCQSQQPELVWIYLLRGFALGQLGNYAAAEVDFDRALERKPSPATLYVLYNNRGVMRFGQKRAWAKGVADLQLAATLRPDQYQARASLAEAYRQAGRFAEAGAYLDEALVLAGRQVRAGDLRPATLVLLHHSRARLHLQRGDREAAVRALAEAARLAGNDGPLRARSEVDRGRVLHLQERFEEALAAFNVALQADPGRVDVLRWRGEVLLVQRRYQEAAAAFDAFLDKGGTPSAPVYRQRGLAHASLGRHAEAIDDYSRALETRSKDEEKVGLVHLIGHTQGSQGLAPAAGALGPMTQIIVASRVTGIDAFALEKKAPLYLCRGQEYLSLNALQPALRDFEEAHRLEPKRVDALLGCAHVRVKLGDLQRGLAEADQIIKGEPKEPRLWHGAARVYAQAAHLKAEPGQEARQARIRHHHQEQAVVLLRKALDRVPADQRRGYWLEYVVQDTALSQLRALPEFAQLAARFGGQPR